MSIFLTPYSLLPIQRIDSLASSSWFGGFVLIVLIALALSVSAHRKQYALYVHNLINKQGRVMNYDTESTSAWANIFLWFVVVSGFGLAIVSLFYSQFSVLNFQLIFLYFFLAVYLGFKWLLIRFVGYVFGIREQALSFSTDYFVIIALLGLLLLPISFGIIYMPGIPDLVWSILLLCIAFIVLITLFIKLLQIFYTGISSLLYIFLYLCTSEILPLFVAVKIAQMW